MIRSLSQTELVTRVVGELRRAGDDPGFTLLLGGGFSEPTVPTASRLALEIPKWLGRDLPAADKQAFVSNFWSHLRKQSANAFDLANGIPVEAPGNRVQAYQAAMSGRHQVGLSTPSMRRDFLRDVISQRGRAINSAHLFLAGILARQDTWTLRRPFARTIFTTNFDSLLQRALQQAHKLYYMTDRPEFAFEPEDERGEAIHLVYLHGSIHRYDLRNTPEELAAARSATASTLRTFLARHGLIVIGYGGWNDAMMAAVNAVPGFDGNLYWCDRHSPEIASRYLEPSVTALLERLSGNAFYVPINGAGALMAQIHVALGLDVFPDFVTNPLAAVIRELEAVELGMGSPTEKSEGTAASPAPKPPRTIIRTGENSESADRPGPVGVVAPEGLKDLQARTITRLQAAEKYYEGLGREEAADVREKSADPAAKAGEIAAMMNEALLAWYRGHYALAVEIWGRIADDREAAPADRQRARVNRGISYERLGDGNLALAEYSLLIDNPEALPELLTVAFTNRGILLGQAGDRNAAEADFTRVLGLRLPEGTSRATALNNRGLSRIGRGEFDVGMADFAAVINGSDAPPEQKAIAYFNRGTSLHERGDDVAAIKAFTEGLGGSSIPGYSRARLLYNRAFVAGIEDPARGIADYTELLRIDGITPFDRARALHNRGVLQSKLGASDDAIADYTTAFEIESAPVDIRVEALLARAYRKQKIGLQREAIDDYTRVADWDAAGIKNQARARLNRAILLGKSGEGGRANAEIEVLLQEASDIDVTMRAHLLRGQARLREGRRAEALRDFDVVVSWDGAAVVRAQALGERGWLKFEGDPTMPDAAVADYKASLELDPSLGLTRANLALALILEGDEEKARAEYRRAIKDIQTEPDLNAILLDLTKYGAKPSVVKWLAQLVRRRMRELQKK